VGRWERIFFQNCLKIESVFQTILKRPGVSFSTKVNSHVFAENCDFVGDASPYQCPGLA
jgi:hypothetical protein